MQAAARRSLSWRAVSAALKFNASIAPCRSRPDTFKCIHDQGTKQLGTTDMIAQQPQETCARPPPPHHTLRMRAAALGRASTTLEMAESAYTLAGLASVGITQVNEQAATKVIGRHSSLGQWCPCVAGRCPQSARRPPLWPYCQACLRHERTRAGSQGWRPCMQNELPTCITTPFSVLQAGGRGQAREREPAADSGCCAAACRQPLRTQQAFPCR